MLLLGVVASARVSQELGGVRPPSHLACASVEDVVEPVVDSVALVSVDNEFCVFPHEHAVSRRAEADYDWRRVLSERRRFVRAALRDIDRVTHVREEPCREARLCAALREGVLTHHTTEGTARGVSHFHGSSRVYLRRPSMLGRTRARCPIRAF